jgi:hypothetical protein
MLSHDQNMYSEAVFICAQLSTQLGGKKLPARESALHHRKEIHWNTGAREGTFSSAQAKPVGQREPIGLHMHCSTLVDIGPVMSIFTPMRLPLTPSLGKRSGLDRETTR